MKENTSFKRLSYGFSALVMSLSAVNFMPALSGSAYAEEGTDTAGGVLTGGAITNLTGTATATLAENLNIYEPIAVSASEEITIDLNGYNIVQTEKNNPVFRVEDGGTLTITGSGMITPSNRAIVGASSKGTVNIKGGTYASKDGVTLFNGGTLNVSGGDFAATTASDLKAATTITGGKFSYSVTPAEGYAVYEHDDIYEVVQAQTAKRISTINASKTFVKVGAEKAVSLGYANVVKTSDGEEVRPVVTVTDAAGAEVTDGVRYELRNGTGSNNGNKSGRVYLDVYADTAGTYKIKMQDGVNGTTSYTVNVVAYEINDTISGNTYHLSRNDGDTRTIDLTNVFNNFNKDVVSVNNVESSNEDAVKADYDEESGILTFGINHSTQGMSDITVTLNTGDTLTFKAIIYADYEDNIAVEVDEDFVSEDRWGISDTPWQTVAEETESGAISDLKITPVTEGLGSVLEFKGLRTGTTTLTLDSGLDSEGVSVKKKVNVVVYNVKQKTVTVEAGSAPIDLAEFVEVPDGYSVEFYNEETSCSVASFNEGGQYVMPNNHIDTDGSCRFVAGIIDAGTKEYMGESKAIKVFVIPKSANTEIADEYLPFDAVEQKVVRDYWPLSGSNYVPVSGEMNGFVITSDDEGVSVSEVGLEVTFTTVGGKTLKFTELDEDEDEIISRDALVHVYGMTLPEEVAVVVGQELTIDEDAEETKISRYLSDTVEIATSEDLEARLENGKIVLKANKEGNYKVKLWNSETIDADGNTERKEYTLNVKAEATPVLEVTVDKTEAKVYDEITFDTSESLNGTVSVAVAKGETEITAASEVENNTFVYQPTEAGTYTFTFTIAGDDNQVETKTVVVSNYDEMGISHDETDVIDLFDKANDAEATFTVTTTEGTTARVADVDGLAITEGEDGSYTVTATKDAEESDYEITVEQYLGDTGTKLSEKTVTIKVVDTTVEMVVVATVNGEEFDDRAEVRLGEDDEIEFNTKDSTTGADIRMSVNGIETEEFTADEAGTYIVSFDLYYNDSVIDTRVFTVVVNPAYELNVVATSDEEPIASGAIVAQGQTITFNTTNSEGTVKVNGEEVENNAYEFTAEKEGAYTFTFALSEKEDETETYTINVVAEPSTDEVALIAKGKTYQGSVESAWSVDKVEICDEETGETCATLAEPGQNFEANFEETGRYTVTAYHNFGDEAVALKSALVIVYDVDEAASDDTPAATLNRIADEFASVVDTLNNLGEDATFDEIAEAMNALENAGKHIGKSFGSDPTSIMNVAGAIMNGETLTTEITGTDAPVDEARVSDAAKTEIAKVLAGRNISEVEYYDINAVVKNEDGDIIANLRELDKEATLAIALDTAPDGYTRTYYVVRYHDGAAEIIAEGVADGSQIVFKTNKFSTYALAYSDTKNATETAATASVAPKTNKTKRAKAPNTGASTESGVSNATASAVISSLVMASLISLIGVVKFAKKQARK